MLSNLFTDKGFRHIIYDFETSSVNIQSPDNKAWQLAFLVCEGEQVLEEHSYYLWWDPLPITKGAAAVTKFNYQEYKNKAVDPKPILELFESYLYNPDYWIIGHNLLGFDVLVHNIWRKNHGLKSDWSYLNRLVDTDALARGIKKELKYSKTEDFISYQYRMASIIEKGLKTNLTALGREQKIEDINYEILHVSALEDIKLNKKVWDRWIKWQYVY